MGFGGRAGGDEDVGYGYAAELSGEEVGGFELEGAG